MWECICSSLFNSTVYIEFLGNIMLPNVRSLSILYQINLLNDNSLVYKSKLVQNWLKNRKYITLLPDLDPK